MGPPLDTSGSEMIAMDAVMEAERQKGYQPRDVSSENLGYDIESLDVVDWFSPLLGGQGAGRGSPNREADPQRSPHRPE